MGEVGLHLPQHERVDLGVDLDAPADRPIDRGRSLDDLDLLPRAHVLATELRGQDHAVDAGVDHLLHRPAGHVPDLLSLVTRLEQVLT